ncbi:hypothetical protein AB0C14_26075 [Microbispora hainanensis]
MNNEQKRDFAGFVSARSDSLVRLAYVLTNDQYAAEDLLQTALTKTAGRWNKIRDNPGAYVRKVMYHEQVVRPGYRNGHCPTTVKTTSGPVTVARPKLRGTAEAFASRLFGTGVSRTNTLETLVIASFVRGLPSATSKARWPTPSAPRPRCPSRRSRRSARPS